MTEAMDGVARGGDLDREVAEVVTDSRIARRGDVFVALPGARFDGHDFVPAALAAGTAGVVVERGRAGHAPGTPAAGGAAVIEVDDTLTALQALARAVRRAAGSRVVAITGSTGKTTTKEAIAELLGTRFSVVRNHGNLNNHIGLPLSLLQLRRRPEVAVMELGMNHAGEIRTLVGIAEPEVRVWTNVGDAHLGFFASRDAIADAKAEILEGADARSVLVANADDPLVTARVGAFVGRTLTFGTSPSATVRAEAIEDRGLDGMRARVVTPAGARSLETPLLGRGNLANLLAATAVAIDFGVTLDEAAACAARLRPPARRGAVHRLRDGVTLVDDSYNSSPSALRRALEVLSGEPRAARKVAVVGEMLELGDHALALHRSCGAEVAASGVHALVAVGGAAARALADAAITAGMAPSSVSYFETSEEAAAAVARRVAPGDLVLVKGSRGVRTDVVADRLLADLT
jgi:UDP-N-acetylmuramoyl-tripeptide--D-alanyl-D-alanine ligase